MILTIDCSANLCAACVYDEAGAMELGRQVLDLGKGHAEHLMSVIEAALKAAGKTYADLTAIAVSTGPGSFTGVRVGVATARGLALALKIPSIGITTLDVLAAQAREKVPGCAVLAVLDGGRGEIHVAHYDAAGTLRRGPVAATLEETVSMIGDAAPVLAGTAARVVAEASGRVLEVASVAATADIAVYARLAATRIGNADEKPSPVYLREADAKPQAGFVLPRR